MTVRTCIDKTEIFCRYSGFNMKADKGKKNEKNFNKFNFLLDSCFSKPYN